MLKEIDWDIKIEFRRKTLRKVLNSMSTVRMRKLMNKRIMKKILMKIGRKLFKRMMNIRNIKNKSRKMNKIMRIKISMMVLITNNPLNSNTWILHSKNMSARGIFRSRISDFMTVEDDHNLQVLSKEVLTTVKM